MEACVSRMLFGELWEWDDIVRRKSRRGKEVGSEELT